MDNAIKGIMIAVGVIITCVIISMALYLTGQGQNAGSSLAKVYGNVNDAITNNDINDYVTDEITGADVINFVRRYHEDLDIFTLQRNNYDNGDMRYGTVWQGTNIKTNPAGTMNLALNYNAIAWNERDPKGTVLLTDGNKDFLFNISNYSLSNHNYILEPNNFTKNIPRTLTYINPNNKYKGFTIKNQNGVTTGLYFVQQDGLQAEILPGNSTGNSVPTPGDGTGSGDSGGGTGGSSGSGDTISSDVIIAMSQTVNATAEAVTRLTEELTNIKQDLFNAINGGNGSQNNGGSNGVDASSLQAQISDLSTQYLEIKSTLDNVQAMISANTIDSTTIGDLQQGLKDNKDATADLQSKITIISSKLDYIETKLTELSGQITGLQKPTTGTGSDSTGSGSSSTSSLSTSGSTNALYSLNELNSINRELQSVTELLLETTEYVEEEDAQKLNDSLSSMQKELQEASEVTDMLGERLVE